MGLTLSFFDIDETIFHSFARVYVRNKHTGKLVTKLDNQDFNSHILDDDEEYDFSEFQDSKYFQQSSKVIKSTLAEVKKQYSQGNYIIFLTARSDMDDNAEFKNTFRKVGIRVNDKRVRFELAGNLKHGPIPQRKMYVINKYITQFKKKGIDEIQIYDDHKENVRILDQVANRNPDIKFKKFLIKKGKIIPYGELNMKTFKEFTELEEAKRMKYDKVIKKLRDGEWDTSMDVKKRMHLTYTDNNTGKEKVVFVESNDLEEGYAIDLNPWKLSHGGQSPKGKGTWAFDYKVSVDSGGMIGLQQDTFLSKAMSTYKDAVKQLTKFLKKEFKAKPKDVKIKLAP